MTIDLHCILIYYCKGLMTNVHKVKRYDVTARVVTREKETGWGVGL